MSRSFAVFSLVAATLAPACYAPHGKPAAEAREVEADCPAPPDVPSEWRHRRSRAVAALGASHHAASDPLVEPGAPATVEGKFAYGSASKDLEDEDVTVWIRTRRCGRWSRVARARTDGDGRARVEIPAEAIAEPGAYVYRFIVAGDLTFARGRIWVVPRGTEVVVFDIDGTLTTGDREIVAQTAAGTTPDMYEGADQVAKLYREAGYLPVYLTGRPYMYRAGTRRWLERRRFPSGPLITTASWSESWPSPGGVGSFKREQLEALSRDRGLQIVAAYGNATTDICAYAEAGIAASVTYIAGKHAGEACGDGEATQPIGDYREHADTLELDPAARSTSRSAAP